MCKRLNQIQFNKHNSFLDNMEPHPIHSLFCSSDILNELICDFEREINSKRQQSKIKSITDLIVVLYKRNVVNRSNYRTILHNVLSCFPNITDKVKIKDFVNSLDRQSDELNTNTNQYGEFEFPVEAMNSKVIIHFDFSPAKASPYENGWSCPTTGRCC